MQCNLKVATKEQIERFHRLWTADEDKLPEGYSYSDDLKLNSTIFSKFVSISANFVKDGLVDLKNRFN
jgi:hypothetical protein